MELVEKHFPHRNPISAYPFYVLVETSGSHESHDREVRGWGEEGEAGIKSVINELLMATKLPNLPWWW